MDSAELHEGIGVREAANFSSTVVWRQRGTTMTHADELRAREAVVRGPPGVVFEIKRRDKSQPPGEVLGNPFAKKFLSLLRAFFLEKGVGLALVTPD